MSYLEVKLGSVPSPADRPRAGRPKKQRNNLSASLEESLCEFRKRPPWLLLKIWAQNTERNQVQRLQDIVSVAGDSRQEPSQRNNGLARTTTKRALIFRQRHRQWSSGELGKVLWTYKANSCLTGGDGARTVRLPIGQKNNPYYAIGTVQHALGNLMVYGGFTPSRVVSPIKIHGRMSDAKLRIFLENHAETFGDSNLPSGLIFQLCYNPNHH